jgi:hypothetical protein
MGTQHGDRAVVVSTVARHRGRRAGLAR